MRILGISSHIALHIFRLADADLARMIRIILPLLILSSACAIADVNCPSSESDDVDAVITDHVFISDDNGTPENSCLASNTITVGGVPMKWVIVQQGAEVDFVAPGGIGLSFGVSLEQGSIFYAGPAPMGPLNTGRLNDTGIVTCSNDDIDGLDCPVTTHPGQDAEYGRDVTHNDDSDGYAGFSFTKLDADGNPLPSSATTWSCVKDNVTDLIWEVKTDDGGLHDMDDSYNWYNINPATNGGHPGYADNDGAICYGYDSGDPASFCNTQAYTERVNQAGLCGRNDWRMPTREEIRSLLDLSVYYTVTIDTDYFPNTSRSNHWSSSPLAADSEYAWFLEFLYGDGSSQRKYSNYHVRLVRDGQ